MPSDATIDLGQAPAPPPGEQPSSLSGVSAVDWAAIEEEPGSSGSGTPKREPSDSAIDLGGHAVPPGQPASASGISAVEWAALVDEPAPPLASHPDTHVRQSPHTGEMPAAPDTGEMADLLSEPKPAEGAGTPAVPAPADTHEPPPVPALASDVEMARDLYPGEPVAPSAGTTPSDSAIDLGAAAEVTDISSVQSGKGPAAVADSGIELGEVPVEYVAPPPAGESGIDLGEAPAVESAPGSSSDEAMTLTEPAPPASESPSGRDLIAEQVESDVDMHMPRMEIAPEGPAPSAEEVTLEAAPAPGEPPSSTVDLGSSAEGLGSSFNLADQLRREQAAAAGGAAEMVDLAGLPAVPAEGSSGLSAPEAPGSAVDLGSQAEVDPMALPSPAPGSDSSVNLEEIQEAAASPSGAPAGEEPPAQTYRAAVALGGAPAGEEPPLEEHDHAAPGSAETATYDVRAALAAQAAEAQEAAGGAPEEPAEPLVAEAPEEEERELVAAGAAPPRGRGSGWLGGSLVGLVVGGGAALGLWLFGIEPPASWRLAGGESAKNAAQPANQPGTGGPGAAGGPGVAMNAPESAQEYLKRGDLQKAAEAGIDKVQGDNPEQLAARGEHHWLTYLQKQHAEGKALKADDPVVKEAVADLTKANTAEALFWLGHLQESTGQLKQARATYEKGLQQFPERKRRFEAALNHLELRSGGGDAGAWLPNDPAAVALLLVALQPPANADKSEEEAGFDFWQAVKLARSQDYAGAVAALEAARKLHDRRRFTQLRKAQNPLSDPTEEIFLTAADQLKEYWQVQEKLKQGGYLDTAKRNVSKAVDQLVQKASEGGGGMQALAEKLVKEKVIDKPADAAAGVEKLLSERKDDRDKIATLEKEVVGGKNEAKALADKVKEADQAKAKVEANLKEVTDRVAAVKEALAEDETLVKKVMEALTAAKMLDAKAGKDAILKGVANALKLASVADKTGEVRELQARADRAEKELKDRWKPEDLLVVWLPVLEQERSNKEFAARAEADAARVQADASASPEARARAEVVRGLALRNQGKEAEAKAALEKASRELAGDAGPFRARAEEALKEVADPGVFYVRRAEELIARGQTAEALEYLGRALKVLPEKDRPALLARRSLIELDQARAAARGPLAANDPGLAAARKDAAEAAQSGSAEGLYAAGRVAEESGQYGAAAEQYRKALAAHPAADPEGARYRMALARMLLQPGRPLPAPAPAPEGEKTGRAPGDSWRFLALLSVLGLQAAGDEAGRDEAERLADEVLKMPNAPRNLRAQALAIKGRWTEAWATYVEGLRPVAPDYAAGLADLLRRDPRMKRSEGVVAANPLEAEKYYAAGLNFYFDREYTAAERSFQLAVQNDSQDARYFYFLGLARLALGQREQALADLDQGGLLESMNKPSAAAVSDALERVQGPMRRMVNDARSKPR
jgi:hypothetical protein